MLAMLILCYIYDKPIFACMLSPPFLFPLPLLLRTTPQTPSPNITVKCFECQSPPPPPPIIGRLLTPCHDVHGHFHDARSFYAGHLTALASCHKLGVEKLKSCRRQGGNDQFSKLHFQMRIVLPAQQMIINTTEGTGVMQM